MDSRPLQLTNRLSFEQSISSSIRTRAAAIASGVLADGLRERSCLLLCGAVQARACTPEVNRGIPQTCASNVGKSVGGIEGEEPSISQEMHATVQPTAKTG